MTHDPAFESNKPWFKPGTKVLIKTLGPGGPSLEALWEGPNQVILSSPTTVKVPGLIHGCTTRVKSGILTPQAKPIILSLFSMLLLFHFSNGPDNLYMGLLLLTPKS